MTFSKAVHENEVSIAVDLSLAANSRLLLILPLFKKGLSDEIQHGNTASACPGLGSIYIEVAAIRRVIVVNQGVIDVDDALIRVNITPAEANRFSYSHTCAEHDCKDWIPVPILRIASKKPQKKDSALPRSENAASLS